jgi:hypothetical protein
MLYMLLNVNVIRKLLLLANGVLLLISFDFFGATNFSSLLRCHHCLLNDAILKRIER